MDHGEAIYNNINIDESWSVRLGIGFELHLEDAQKQEGLPKSNGTVEERIARLSEDGQKKGIVKLSELEPMAWASSSSSLMPIVVPSLMATPLATPYEYLPFRLPRGLVVAGQCAMAMASGHGNLDTVHLYPVNGISAKRVKAAINAILDELLLSRRGPLSVHRTQDLVTILCPDDSVSRIRITLRRFESISEVLYSLDLGSRSVAYDGTDFWFSAAGRLAYETSINVVEFSHYSTAYDARLCRAFSRGFAVAMPDLAVDHPQLVRYNSLDLRRVCVDVKLRLSPTVIKASRMTPNHFGEEEDAHTHRGIHNLEAIVTNQPQNLVLSHYNFCISNGLSDLRVDFSNLASDLRLLALDGVCPGIKTSANVLLGAKVVRMMQHRHRHTSESWDLLAGAIDRRLTATKLPFCIPKFSPTTVPKEDEMTALKWYGELGTLAAVDTIQTIWDGIKRKITSKPLSYRTRLQKLVRDAAALIWEKAPPTKEPDDASWPGDDNVSDCSCCSVTVDDADSDRSSVDERAYLFGDKRERPSKKRKISAIETNNNAKSQQQSCCSTDTTGWRHNRAVQDDVDVDAARADRESADAIRADCEASAIADRAAELVRAKPTVHAGVGASVLANASAFQQHRVDKARPNRVDEICYDCKYPDPMPSVPKNYYETFNLPKDHKTIGDLDAWIQRRHEILGGSKQRLVTLEALMDWGNTRKNDL